MGEQAVAHDVLTLWLEDVDSLESWLCAVGAHAEGVAVPEPGAGGEGATCTPWPPPVQQLRDALQALLRGEAAVPAEVGLYPPDTALRADGLQGWMHGLYSADRPIADLRQLRQSLLRLAVWRALRRRTGLQALSNAGDAFGLLLRDIARAAHEGPPGIAATVHYAPRAHDFFDRHVRRLVAQLARSFPVAADALHALLQTPPYDDSAQGVLRWGKVWTVAVAGTYLHLLHRRSNASLDEALAVVWGAGGGCRRFKPQVAPAVPTERKGMSLDLWTSLVPAQALAHDPARFAHEAAGQRWHRVRVAVHDLGQRDTHERGVSGRQTVYRGWSVEMVYQAVLADALWSLPAPAQEVSMRPAPTLSWPLPVIAGFPRLAPGQQANVQLAVGWISGPGALRRRDPAGADENAPAATTVAMSLAQRALFEGWRRQHAGGAEPVAVAALQGLGPDADMSYADERGAPLSNLGSAQLWPLAGADAAWLELACVVRHRGRWVELPLVLHDRAERGELRSCLLADAAAWPTALPMPPVVAAALFDEQASFWAVHRMDLGATVLAVVDLDRQA